MKKQIVFTVMALVLTTGSFFLFANKGVSSPSAADCTENCEPYCCDDNGGLCETGTCDFTSVCVAQ